jgi:hypothetical protein
MNRKRELRVIDYLQHILDAIERIESYLADSDEQTFAQSADPRLLRHQSRGSLENGAKRSA